MPAVVFRFRSECHHRWRAWLGLGLLIGLSGGAVLTLAAGARRTDSVYSRFLRSQRAYDVLVVNLVEDQTAIFDFDELAALPQVLDSARAGYFFVDLGEGVVGIASSDNRIGTELNRFKLLEGRAANPGVAGEVVVSSQAAHQFHLELGDTISVFDPDTILDEIGSAPPDVLSAEQKLELSTIYRRAVQVLPEGEVTVVGVEASPGGFPPASIPTVYFTPAYDRLDGPNDGAEVLAVRLRRGAADLAAFQRELERRSGGQDIQAIVQADHARNVERSFHLQAVALWLLAGGIALTASVIAAQLLSRQSLLEARDSGTLTAVGFTQRQRFGMELLRAGVIGSVAAVVAIVVAYWTSFLFPTGLAEMAEPNPGLRADAAVLALGASGTIVVTMFVASVSAWRTARVRAGLSTIDQEPAVRVSRGAGALAGVGFPPSAVIGVRMALEPGRGRTAVPVRASIVPILIGVAAMTAAVTVGASLAHLVRTPRLYGVGWNTVLTNFGFGADLSTLGVQALRATGDTDGAAIASAIGDPLEIQGEQAFLLAIDPVYGDVLPPVLEGRAPRAVGEVALGTRIMADANVQIGDTVTARVPGVTSTRLRVVGRAIIPTVNESSRLGEGALVNRESALRLEPDERSDVGLLVRRAPNVSERELRQDLEAGLERLCAQTGDASCSEGTEVSLVEIIRPDSFVNFGGAEELPFALAATLGVVSAATLAYVLVSSLRRRRRDFALLKALGFTGRQVGFSVAWQAMTLTVVALAAGLPVGIAGGRWAWSLLAADLGVISAERVPASAVAMVVVGALLLAIALAGLPARVASRTRPAIVLRSE